MTETGEKQNTGDVEVNVYTICKCDIGDTGNWEILYKV